MKYYNNFIIIMNILFALLMDTIRVACMNGFDLEHLVLYIYEASMMCDSKMLNEA